VSAGGEQFLMIDMMGPRRLRRDVRSLKCSRFGDLYETGQVEGSVDLEVVVGNVSDLRKR
jgi:hypothetical protein